MRDARRRVVELLRLHGSLTIGELIQHLHMTRTAVVRHVAVLEREGLVARTGLRMGKRRPSVTFALTEVANGLFPQGYDAFAILLLDEMKRSAGTDAAKATRRISQRWIDRDLPRIGTARGEERLKRAAGILAKHGFMPKLHSRRGTFVLEQYNCPLRRVGVEHPEVCAMVTRWIQALLGVRVLQTQCASMGAAFCRYVPVSSKDRK